MGNSPSPSPRPPEDPSKHLPSAAQFAEWRAMDRADEARRAAEDRRSAALMHDFYTKSFDQLSSSSSAYTSYSAPSSRYTNNSSSSSTSASSKGFGIGYFAASTSTSASSKSFECPDCGTRISGMNCAHTLSRLEGWRNKSGCAVLCSCKYPVNAKQVRSNIFTGYLNGDKSTTSNAYIYCENDKAGGHVYYGTYSVCVRGNGFTASEMSVVKVFERYSSAK